MPSTVSSPPSPARAVPVKQRLPRPLSRRLHPHRHRLLPLKEKIATATLKRAKTIGRSPVALLSTASIHNPRPMSTAVMNANMAMAVSDVSPIVSNPSTAPDTPTPADHLDEA